MTGPIDALEGYAKSVRETLRAGPTNVEQALAPSFKNLIDDLLPVVPAGAKITTLPEYRKPELGRPDIGLARAGQLPRAFIIVLQKAVNHSLTRERLGLEPAPAEDEDERS